MRIVAIIQARCNSKRLPGKVLMKIKDKEIVKYIFESLEQCSNIDEVVLATSNEKSDDPLEMFCKENDYSYFRGNLNNVSSRMENAAIKFDADAFVRVCGDSPLVDPKIVTRAIELFINSEDCDLVTNVFPRSYPIGQSIEVFNLKTFRKILEQFSTNEYKEHISTYIYDNSEKFNIINFKAKNDHSSARLCVDTPDDFKNCKEIISNLNSSPATAGWEKCLEVYYNLRE